jgi:hypothetical protein
MRPVFPHDQQYSQRCHKRRYKLASPSSRAICVDFTIVIQFSRKCLKLTDLNAAEYFLEFLQNRFILAVTPAATAQVFTSDTAWAQRAHNPLVQESSFIVSQYVVHRETALRSLSGGTSRHSSIPV